MTTSGYALAALLGIGSAGAWSAVYGLAMLATRPARPDPAPATQDLPGDEPPAVVSLVTNRWELTEDAAEATLIDLAARRFLEFRQPGDDPAQTTIHVRVADPAGLNAYERRVFDRVAGLAVGGVLPLTALTFRNQGHATSFEKRLRAEVIADARSRGLSRRRFSKVLRTLLTVAAIVAGAGIAGAVLMASTKAGTSGDNSPIKNAGLAWFFSFAVLSYVAHRPLGETDTPAGREVAARWLGVKTWLQRTGSFGDLPPAAVAVWDRYLSYGDALGTTRICAAVIDLGMGNRKRVWSSYGGTWHRVRVRYPGFWARYGRKAQSLIFKAVWTGGIGFLLLYFWAKGVLHQQFVEGSSAAHFADPVRSLGLAAGGLLFAYGLYVLVRTVIDLAAPATVTGQVLWKQVWRSSGGNDDTPATPWLHYFAVDDGTDDRTTAWGLPSELAGRADDGDTVTFTVRRWSRRIVELRVDEAGTGRAAQTADVSNKQTENLIAEAMGLPAAGSNATAGLANLLRAPDAAIGELLSAQEVGQALGIPVTVGSIDGPTVLMRPVIFRGPNGRPVMQLMAIAGLPAQLAMRARRRGAPLPGVGHEAYTGDNWAIGRGGETVILLGLTGAGRGQDPQLLARLLSAAIGRLPARAPG
jgi:hypothetical protein